MNHLLYFILGGVTVSIIINQLPKKSHKKNSQEINQPIILNRISNLETKADRNESDIKSLKENDEQKNLQISQMYGWFGSMIRHSAEEPFKKDAIEKFLAEEELKNTHDTK